MLDRWAADEPGEEEEREVSTWRIGVGATRLAALHQPPPRGPPASPGRDSDTDESELVATWRIGVAALPAVRVSDATVGAALAVVYAQAKRAAEPATKQPGRALGKHKARPPASAASKGAHGGGARAPAVSRVASAARSGEEGSVPVDGSADGNASDAHVDADSARDAKRARVGVGVYRVAQSHRWRAQLAASGRTHYLGTFETREEAIRAYDAAARAHGRTPPSDAAAEPPHVARAAPKLLGVKRRTRGRHHAHVYAASVYARGRRFLLGEYRSARAAAMVYDAFARTYGLPCNYAPPPAEDGASLPLLVGRRVSVFWRTEGVYFDGTLTSFDRELRTFHVDYDDGDTDDGLELGDPEVVLLPTCVDELIVGPRARA